MNDIQDTHQTAIGASFATLMDEGRKHLAFIEAVSVDSDVMYELMVRMIVDDKARKKAQAESRKAEKAPYKQIVDEIDARYKQLEDLLELCIKAGERKALGYRSEVERRRQAEVEALRAAEEAKRQAEQETLIATIQELEAAGLEEGAMAAQLEVELLESAPIVVTPATQVPKAQGLGDRKTWKAEVTDLAELVKAAANNPDLLSLLLPNMPEINKRARALRENANIPGVRAYEETSLVARKS